MPDLISHIAALEAEVGRLREALGGALELLSAFRDAARLPHIEQDPRMVAARAALEEKP